MDLKRHHHVKHHIKKHHKKYLLGGAGLLLFKLGISIITGIGIFEFDIHNTQTHAQTATLPVVVISGGFGTATNLPINNIGFSINRTINALARQRGNGTTSTKSTIYYPNTTFQTIRHFDNTQDLNTNDAPLADSARDFGGTTSKSRSYGYNTGIRIEKSTNKDIDGTNRDITGAANLKYRSADNVRTVDATQNVNAPYNDQTSIRKYWTNPGTGTTVLKWTSPIDTSIKIRNSISDDNNECGDGILYGIFKGDTATPILPYTTWTSGYTGWVNLTNNFTETVFEWTGDIKKNDTFFFAVNRSGNNLCDITHNLIQIFENAKGIATEGPTFNSGGKRNGAFEFNGKQAYGIGTDINQSTTDGITISAWVNTNDITTKQGIVVKNDAYGIIYSSGSIRVSPSTFWGWHDTKIQLKAGEWTHIAWTYNGTTMKAYKNGNSVWTYNVNGSLGTNNNITYIGRDPRNQRGRKGLIDELRIFAKALPADDIRWIANSNFIGTYKSRQLDTILTGFEDGKYEYTIREDSSDKELINGSAIIDYNPPTLTTTIATTTDEGSTLTIDPNRTDLGIGMSPTTGCDRTVDIGGQKLSYINTGCTLPLGVRNEPTTGKIAAVGRDYLGRFNNSWSGVTIERKNLVPTVKPLSEEGEEGTNIIFTADGSDPGGTTNTGYQRFSDNACTTKIPGETGNKYIDVYEGTDFPHIENLSYAMYDAQGLSNCATATANRIASTIVDNNRSYNLKGGTTGIIFLSGIKIEKYVENGKIGICTGIYTGYDSKTGTVINYNSGNNQLTGRGTDSCIIKTTSGDTITLGRYNINTNIPLLNLTGIGLSGYFSDISRGNMLSIWEDNFTTFSFNLSGKTSNIYGPNLVALYNFDRILLTNNQRDFSIIQTGNNRGYVRSPQKSNKYYPLIYDPTGKQRSVSGDFQKYDGLFIDKDELNPGEKYGDVALSWTSPVDAKIQIESTLTDENSTCGDGITYKIIQTGKYPAELHSGTYEILTKETTVTKDDIIYFRISSSGDNDCDTSKININIYQTPETNIGTITENTHGTAVNTTYSNGKFGGAYSFDATTTRSVTIGTGLWKTSNSEISIATRVYRNNPNPNQTILKKQGSFGLVIYNNTIQVTNKTTNKRYDTSITIDTGMRTHLAWTYNGTLMHVYKNGNEVRSGKTIGTVPTSDYPLQIGYSATNGQRIGMIDELYIYNTEIDANTIKTLASFNLNKTDKDHWMWSSNDQAFIDDGKYIRTGTTNTTDTGGDLTIDFYGPQLEIRTATGYEENNLIISGQRFDNGVGINTSGFNRDLNNDNTFEILNTGESIMLPMQNEPTGFIIGMQAKDTLGHITTKTGRVEWLNKSPIVEDIEEVGEAKTNITFFADAKDAGATISYQRFSGNTCGGNILGTGKTFKVRSGSLGKTIFSYYAKDSQGSGDCATATATRTTATEYFTPLIATITGDNNGGIISGTRTGNYTEVDIGDKILTNGNKGICILTGLQKDIIQYTPYMTGKGNDSCIMQAVDGTKIIIAINSIHNEIFSRDTLPQIITNNYFTLTGIIDIDGLEKYTLQESGYTTTGTTISLIDIANMLTMYNFDTFKITSLSNDFGKTQGENNRYYYRENSNGKNLLNYNPENSSRVITKNTNDSEDLYIKGNETNPGMNKFGNSIYTRRSNTSGKIIIDSAIRDLDTSCGDGISYSIHQCDKDIYSTIVSYQDTKKLAIHINSGEELSFVINSNTNNQCDTTKIDINIYNTPGESILFPDQPIIYSGTYEENSGKFGGSYKLSGNGDYLNIGTGISQKTGITFSLRLNGNGSNANQTIIRKDGSYGLSILNNTLWVTTNTNGLRYSTKINKNQIINNKWNNIIRSYNSSIMKVFINGQETRSGKILGILPVNSSPTIIGYSNDHGQLSANVDEIHVYNSPLSNDEIRNIASSFIEEIGINKRNVILNKTGLGEDTYTYTGTINDTKEMSRSTTIDLLPPSIIFTNLTGEENSGINLTTDVVDTGAGIDYYDWDFDGDNTFEITGKSSNSRNMAPVREPYKRIIGIRARDKAGRYSIKTGYLEWINLPIQTKDLSITGNESEILTFIATGEDAGGTSNIKYQRYLGSGCGSGNIITGATTSIFSTGRDEPTTRLFSYTMRDAQGMTGTCALVTGERYNTAPISFNLKETNKGNVTITFTGKVIDTGTSISYQRYQGTNCLGTILSTTGTLSIQKEQAFTGVYSYKARDDQNTEAYNNENTGTVCSIATGIRTTINPIADSGFILATTTSNKTVSGNWITLAHVRDSESSTGTLTGSIVVQGTKGTFSISGKIITYIPDRSKNSTGKDEALIKIIDNNNGVSYTTGTVFNIETTKPTTTISNMTGYYRNTTGISFSINYNDENTGSIYYYIQTGDLSCSANTGIYKIYTATTTGIRLGTNTGVDLNKTICFFGNDIYGNQETPKKQLYRLDGSILTAYLQTKSYVKNIFEATIYVNKACTGTIIGINNTTKNLTLNTGSNSVSYPITETSGIKAFQLSLATSDPTDGSINQIYSYTIDQIAPTTPTITEKTEGISNYSIKRGAVSDIGAGLQGYNYKVLNENGVVLQNGFTADLTASISKVLTNYSTKILWYIQAIDNVGNTSSRSDNISFSIASTTSTTDTTPNSISFEKKTNAEINTLYLSDKASIIGLSDGTMASVKLSTGTLYINGVSSSANLVQNGDYIQIKLRSSDDYNDSTSATVTIGDTSTTFTIVTQSSSSANTNTTTHSSASSSSFREWLQQLIAQLGVGNTTNTGTTITTTTVTTLPSNIDPQRSSAPYKAPNGKVYKLYKTTEGKYSSYNFIKTKTFSTLKELKKYIDQNNPRK